MELRDAVFGRRMVRSYDADQEVPAELVEMLLKGAIRAPSAGHTQAWRFLVLSDITTRLRFWSATSDAEPGPDDGWHARMQRAPVLIVCFADRQAYLDRYSEADKVSQTESPAPSSRKTKSSAPISPEDESSARSVGPKRPAGRPSGDPSSWPIPYWHVDMGMAVMTLLLGAHDVGLGACFFGVPGHRWEALAAEFAVPDGLEPVGVVSLGWPAPDRRSPSLRRGRKSLADVVAYGSFG